MSLSEDDDFLSADEDGFGDNDQTVASKVHGIALSKPEEKCLKTDELKKNKPVMESSDELKPKPTPSKQRDTEDEAKPETRRVSKAAKRLEERKPAVQDDEVDEDDEEEVLAKIRARISERNIKIAQKFSQEDTSNAKASAPIPVKSTEPIDSFKINDNDYSSSPDSGIKSSPPPAPPPTPALSSSFNSNENVSESQSGSTQYGWRVPSKISRPNEANVSQTDANIEQTRLALDRLSASMSQQAGNKNLFEKVAEDIKKVSLTPRDSPPSAEGQAGSAGHATIPLISDLGSTLGGWKWNGASKLLASASQVTSQVGSVFESVVHVSQPSQPPMGSRVKASQQNQPKSVSELEGEQSATGHAPPSSEFSSNPNQDGLMDFTLNAMESLGKRAFGVMTERNESGSLQIKGLGRPWEHLMNVNKPQHQDKADAEPTGALSLVNRSKKDD